MTQTIYNYMKAFLHTLKSSNLAMSTCFKTLIEHLQIVVRQLEQLLREKSSDHLDQYKLLELSTQVEDLCLEVFDD